MPDPGILVQQEALGAMVLRKPLAKPDAVVGADRAGVDVDDQRRQTLRAGVQTEETRHMSSRFPMQVERRG